MKNIMVGIRKKIGDLHAFFERTDTLSGSQSNSLLLTLFTRLAEKIRPPDLVRHFSQNRFVIPAKIDPIKFQELELACLRLARENHFTPLTLSPLTPLGTCSAVGQVNQNNVVSALRGTEVVSDATNVLAIRIAEECRKQNSAGVIRYAATHRHVRGQSFTNPAYSAHFGVFCLASGGMDEGNFSFEIRQLQEHIKIHLTLLATKFDPEDLFIKIYFRKENAALTELVRQSLIQGNHSFEIIADYHKGDYYQPFQFKIFLKHKGQELDLVDGGMVDWTQKMIPNKKHRLFISGCGLELMEKLMEKQV